MSRAAGRGWWLGVLVVFAVCAGLGTLGWLQPLDDAFADQRARRSMHDIRPEIVIVGIDGASLSSLAPWPWPRRYHARLLDQLARAAPRAVFLDIDLSALAEPADDLALELALNRPRDFPVILPAQFRDENGTAHLSKPRSRFARRTERALVHAQPGYDGRVRTWRTSWNVAGTREASIVDRDRRLPDRYDVSIDYSIAPASFTHVSYADVLAGQVPREVFAGRTVFVGVTAPQLGERLRVPLHDSLPRVVVQALAAETVRAGAPRTLPGWADGALLAIWAAGLALLFGARRGTPWPRNAGVLVLALGLVWGLSWYLFQVERVWLHVAAPALAAALLFVASLVSSLETRTWRALTYALGLRRRDALLKGIVQSSTDCMVCVDEEGIIRTANPAASRLFDCPAYELVDEPISKFITLLAGAGVGARLGELHGVIRECDARTARGDVFPVEISVSRVRLPAERLYAAIVRDIRERRAERRRLHHLATHDSLTGLPNRAALLAHLEGALSARSAVTLALLMLDLCRFKEVNDTLGHGVGDRVLCEVAQRFASTLASEGLAGRCLIARIGGDEFTVVLDAPGSADFISTTAQRLADSLRAPIDLAGIAIEVGVSIGIARVPEDAADLQALLRHADAAMYAAKRRGNPYEFYDTEHDENTTRKLALAVELRAALAGDQLALHYQPQVNLRSGLVESCQAQVRWTHPERGAVSLAELVPVAESTGLIRPLTEWMLSCALAQVRAWRERGVHLRVAVNLSARLLQDSAFPGRLRERLAQFAVCGASLELAIAESSLLVDPARAQRVIQEIAALGVLLAIDGFGAGCSSLGYLRGLPLTSLELDESFVTGMRANVADRTIVESVARMGQALKLKLAARGVASDWDVALLKATGYDRAQGLQYARALPADDFMAWVVDFNATAMLTGGDSLLAPSHRIDPELEAAIRDVS